MKIVIQPIETRLEIAQKILNWNTKDVTPYRIAEILDLKVTEFYRMSEEEFFNTLYSYVHNVEVERKI